MTLPLPVLVVVVWGITALPPRHNTMVFETRGDCSCRRSLFGGCVQIWDLASGTLKLTLTGHLNTIRGLAVSPRHPYLFSAGEDKMVKCT